MNILICDDNKTFLVSIKNQINEYILNITDAKIIATSPELLADQLDNKVCPYDILILDIQMGDYDGIAFAKKANAINPQCSIIFISNYLKMATKVYETPHIYFILKSELHSMLPKALNQAMKLFHENQFHRFISLSIHGKKQTVMMDDIMYAEVNGRHLSIHTKSQVYTYNHTLKELLESLPDEFIRIHNSFIVNLKYIHILDHMTCVLIDESKLPISRTYKKGLLVRYNEYLTTFI